MHSYKYKLLKQNYEIYWKERERHTERDRDITTRRLE